MVASGRPQYYTGRLINRYNSKRLFQVELSVQMRVLVVTSQFPLPGDLQRGRAVYQTIQHLSRIASVSVLSPVASYPMRIRPRSYVYHAAPKDFDAGVPVRYVTFPVLPIISRPFSGWLCARALEREIENAHPDVVLSYWLYPDAYGALTVARRLKIPMVAGARGSDLRARDPISRHMARRVVRDADRLLVVSKDLERIATTRDGARADRVRVIPNGCDSKIFHIRDRQAARDELGVTREAALLLYVGRLVPEKGLRELLKAMEILRPSHPALRLAIVGDGPMRAEIEAWIGDTRSDSTVLVGARDPIAVSTWMAAANVAVLPSYSEGYPNVLVEALACGRAFVSTPVGGVMEIADESCAVLVPPRDAAALALGIVDAVSRDWDEVELARRHSRSWDEVARQTLAACVEARETSRGRA
jgi:glycosyltransferase involved in cell wall biosynthesis